ncbi:hypothetical protein EJ02DRAFT_141833 [Clathrospora elynae]|uniref:RING-type domain-containing protein n=1 Tax=Clathrospora elynae TaxID=706981 RepID=A0A6A5T2I5_9PLEO|nr:hypothetical protein EJ02DRAFT_141833 [Clathrospora elynae]
MPPVTGLPSHEVYIKDLVPVAICSAASPCPICHEDYNEEHAPVLLRGCGHIFGKPCILEWFEEGGNTCPLDRKVLFDTREERDWSLVPFDPLREQSNGSGSGALTRQFNRTPVHYLFFSGEIIGVNGYLTREGCRRVVKDLWYHTNQFCRRTQSLQIVNDLDIILVSEAILYRQIHDALPLGISVPEEAWPLLISMARMMLSWQCHSWEMEWEARMPREEIEVWSDEIWGVCEGDDEARL